MTVADFLLQKVLAADTDSAIPAASFSDIHRNVSKSPENRRGQNRVVSTVCTLATFPRETTHPCLDSQ